METELEVQYAIESRTGQQTFQEIATEGWKVDAMGLVAGISFDDRGMHVIMVWTNGCLVYELVAWNRAARYVREWGARETERLVDDIYINDWSARLTAKQTKLKKTVVGNLLALPGQLCLRVYWCKKASDSTATGLAGKAHSIEAASHGYLKKLAELRAKHKKCCQALRNSSETLL